MLSIQEVDELRSLLEQRNRAKERSRDEKGRFIAESKSESVTKDLSASHYKERRIKVVKVPGSYGKYEIRDVWLDETDKEILGVIVMFAVLAIIF